jgi:hypothetical protein
MYSGASSAAYTAIRTELTTLNTADTTSSSFTGKGTMDIDGRAGATGVAVAGGTLAKWLVDTKNAFLSVHSAAPQKLRNYYL